MKHTRTIQALATLDRPLTFAGRLEEIRAATLQNHCDAALAARADFEDRVTRAVKRRVDAVLDAITAD